MIPDSDKILSFKTGILPGINVMKSGNKRKHLFQIGKENRAIILSSSKGWFKTKNDEITHHKL